MKKIKAVLFDLDGTLTDTLQDLTNAVNYALAENGMPLRTLAEVRKMVGNGLYSLAGRVAKETSSDMEKQRVYESLTSYYKEHTTDCTHPYPGIVCLLEKLKATGVKLAVLSNKADAPTKAIVERFFPGVFHAVLGQREGVPQKPDPTPVHEVLSLLGVTQEETVYVGDSEVDVQTARNANLSLYAVTWGFRDVEELLAAGATTLYHSAEELLNALFSRV
ncbi:MAG: HAD family hydrolase [Clostridiales bacterium]|nr:HAD family hydrolase [Clostridiales bacterium]